MISIIIVGAMNVLKLGYRRLACGEKLLDVVNIGTLVPKLRDPTVAS